MNSTSGLRFLRPYLSNNVPAIRNCIYIRFFNTTRCLADAVPSGPGRPPGQKKRSSASSKASKSIASAGSRNNALKNVQDRVQVELRIEELQKARALNYPRMKSAGKALTLEEYQKKYEHLKAGEGRPQDVASVNGRILALRVAGKALVFLDIVQNGHYLQVLCRATELGAFSGVSPQEFQEFYHLVRRGDIISILGTPYTTKSAELSINATELPVILAPSLPILPSKLEDPETRIRNRHVDLLVNRRVADTIRVRSHIIQYIRDFLLKDNFLEVQTPIIAERAGGAIARPFTTVATEFSDKQLALRIAPEIWLKRMVLGGMDRVFEIGPSFRNEGLDATHNPEFTTCEFYKSYADLEALISMTEKLLSGLAEHVNTLQKYPLKDLPELDVVFTTPFKRIQFIPALEEKLGEKLPDLAAKDAQEKLLVLFAKHSLTLPSSATLPKLLDKLSSMYLEPECTAPTFIMHHPACLAPLSKSFLDSKTKQLVSARVELFIQNHEIANMYEEENSPFEQRRKFVEQARWKDDENKAVIDESYIQALEWALPPTGGWGCGIDRLCMLFSGASRISDVLAFGSLKNVVNLGRESNVEVKREGAKQN